MPLIQMTIDPIIAQIGPFQLGWHGIFTSLALVAGLWLGFKRAAQLGIDTEAMAAGEKPSVDRDAVLSFNLAINGQSDGQFEPVLSISRRTQKWPLTCENVSDRHHLDTPNNTPRNHS